MIEIRVDGVKHLGCRPGVLGPAWDMLQVRQGLKEGALLLCWGSGQARSTRPAGEGRIPVEVPTDGISGPVEMGLDIDSY